MPPRAEPKNAKPLEPSVPAPPIPFSAALFVATLTHIVPSDIEAEQRRLAGTIDCNGTVLAAGAASDAKLRDEDSLNALQKQEGDFKHMRELLQEAMLDTTPELAEARLRA